VADSTTGLPWVASALSPYTYIILAMLVVGIVLWIVGHRQDNGLRWFGILATAIALVMLAGEFAWPRHDRGLLERVALVAGPVGTDRPVADLLGLPWVGVVSVLLYLAGLANIGQDIYDAAEIDGCGWFRKFWNIELPLILTQVRLNLILMIIGTLQGWGLNFILLGDDGGPSGVGMVPGLYMFHKGVRRHGGRVRRGHRPGALLPDLDPDPGQ